MKYHWKSLRFGARVTLIAVVAIIAIIGAGVLAAALEASLLVSFLIGVPIGWLVAKWVLFEYDETDR